MAAGNTVWGIDIGQCALKAIKLRALDDEQVEAVAFDVIEHPKILSQPDADRDELVRAALEKFASRNDWQGDQFIIGVPGQQTFARFCKMPPIDLKKDAKKIHDLVRYEASQQIPFDIDDVVWDYQVFTSEESPDVEVGIFAMRKELIRKHLDFFSGVGIAPAGVQTVPAALYNFCQFDGQAPEEGAATVIIDVGAQNTDLIIVEENSAWTRNIPLGGNSFTEALVRAFKLSFAKAESLKRSAATSKYARQIFQAMRPVFGDLVSEIQRSIGFYSSTHRDVELKRVLALGNAFQLPGLQKYLETNLTISAKVTKLEKFSKLAANATTNAPQFTENILSFAPAYGLAVQGLGMGRIQATLLPTELARASLWKKKRPYFIATAASLLLASGVPVVANWLDMQTLNSQRAEQMQRKATSIVREAEDYANKFSQAKTNTADREEDIKALLKLQEHKAVLPRVLALANEAMPPIYPPQLAQAESPKEFKRLIEANPQECARTKRGQLIIESLDIQYHDDIAKARVAMQATESVASPVGGGAGGPPGGGGRGAPPMMSRGRGGMNPMLMGRGRGPAPSRPETPQGGEGATGPKEGAGFVVRVQGRLLYGTNKGDARAWFGNYFNNLREVGQQPGMGIYIPPDDPENPGGNAFGGPTIETYHEENVGVFAPPAGALDLGDEVRYPDPLTGEETRYDWRVAFAFKVQLGEAPEAEPEGASEDAAGRPGGAPGVRRGR